MPAPHRVVLDTNVVLALWLFKDPRLTRLRLDLEHARLQWIASTRMLQEIDRELRPDRCARYATTPDQVRQQMARVPMGLLLSDPLDVVCGLPALRCSDADDQIFINAGIDLREAWLLSRDRAVLKVARFARRLGLTVCTPEDWLAAQEGNSPAESQPCS